MNISLAGRLRDNGLFMRLLRNVLHMAGGNAAAVCIGIATLGLTARTLGPAALGLLIMIESYGRFIDQFIRLETWHALIRFGAAAMEKEDTDDFRRLIKFGMLLDFTGATAAAFIAFLAVPIASSWLGWGDETARIVRIYSFVLLFGIGSTPIAVLRLFNRFSFVAWLEPAMAVIRLAGAFIAHVSGMGLWTFVLLSMGVQILHRITLSAIAWRELRKRGYGGLLRARVGAIASQWPGIWNMIWSVNMSVFIRRSTQELDALIVGGVLGPAAVGIYHIAKRLGATASKAGSILQQVAFPDIARLWVRGEVRRFVRLVRHIELVTAAGAFVVMAVLALFADRIVMLIAGKQFSESVVPLIVQMAATVLFLCGSALRPALMNMGLQTQVLKIVIVSASAFYLTLLLSLPVVGVVGASLSHLVFNLIWLPSALVLFSRGIRRHERSVAALAAVPDEVRA